MMWPRLVLSLALLATAYCLAALCLLHHAGRSAKIDRLAIILGRVVYVSLLVVGFGLVALDVFDVFFGAR